MVGGPASPYLPCSERTRLAVLLDLDSGTPTVPRSPPTGGGLVERLRSPTREKEIAYLLLLPTGPCWSDSRSGGRRIGSVTVAALTRTRRGLVSELELAAGADGVPTDYVVDFGNLHTVPREASRRRVATLSAARMAHACRVLAAATGR